jgi:UrcA family protein
MEGESAGKRMTIMFKLLIPAFAALSLATAAQAKKSDQTTLSVTVRYGDLDLASDAGAATLQARIAAAVKTVARGRTCACSARGSRGRGAAARRWRARSSNSPPRVSAFRWSPWPAEPNLEPEGAGGVAWNATTLALFSFVVREMQPYLRAKPAGGHLSPHPRPQPANLSQIDQLSRRERCSNSGITAA